MEYNEIDWNQIWQKMYQENLKCRGTNDCASIWVSKEKAQSFMKQSRENPERIRHVIEGLPIHSGSRVLDIGAGPGTMAVPIAKVAAHVTAVEPSPGMTSVLAEYAEEEGVSNIQIVQKRWEDIDLSSDLDGQYDVVVASYSLGMPDIKEAISAMYRVLWLGLPLLVCRYDKLGAGDDRPLAEASWEGVPIRAKSGCHL